jgi:hypothetical protein
MGPCARGRAVILEATFVPLGGRLPLSDPGCSSAALRHALALGGWPPRVFAPSDFLPVRREEIGTGRARSGHRIRTVILSYAKHGRSQTNAQGHTYFRLFAAAEKAGKKDQSLWLRPLRLGLPQCPAAPSGPRVVRKRNGGVLRRPDTRSSRPDDRRSEIRERRATLCAVVGSAALNRGYRLRATLDPLGRSRFLAVARGKKNGRDDSAGASDEPTGDEA